MTATQTRERGILVTAEMVRAILDGRKTMTRRVVKSQQWGLRCPYGAPGGLWVKETFYDEIKGNEHFVAYRATNAHGDGGLKWKPAIFMPRWASRITLEITDVRVERLQDITEADAKAEGLDAADAFAKGARDFRVGFAGIWELHKLETPRLRVEGLALGLGYRI